MTQTACRRAASRLIAEGSSATRGQSEWGRAWSFEGFRLRRAGVQFCHLPAERKLLGNAKSSTLRARVVVTGVTCKAGAGAGVRRQLPHRLPRQGGRSADCGHLARGGTWDRRKARRGHWLAEGRGQGLGPGRWRVCRASVAAHVGLHGRRTSLLAVDVAGRRSGCVAWCGLQADSLALTCILRTAGTDRRSQEGIGRRGPRVPYAANIAHGSRKWHYHFVKFLAS